MQVALLSSTHQSWSGDSVPPAMLQAMPVTPMLLRLVAAATSSLGCCCGSNEAGELLSTAAGCWFSSVLFTISS
ncbi:MAG: hypothetical protein VXZ35_14410 [Pseudomonadota bacterium]|nr:hypothetical protein [Pseudomonadota bacterium]